MEDKKSNDFYKIHDHTNKKERRSSNVSSCEHVESNAPSSMIDDTDGKDEGTHASSCEEVESDAPPFTIDDTERGKSSSVSSRGQIYSNAIL